MDPRYTITLNEEMVEHFAQAFLQDSLYIGVFENPAPKEFKLIPLHSGVIPELDPNWAMLANSLGIVRLLVNRGIKGSFDTIAFFPIAQTTQLSDPPSALPPKPAIVLPGEQWIIIVKKGYVNGKAVNEWAAQLQAQGDASYIHDQTVFVEAFRRYGAICTQKTKPSSKEKGLQNPKELIEGLEQIQVVMSDSSPQQQKAGLEAIIQSYPSPAFVPAIARKLKDTLNY